VEHPKPAFIMAAISFITLACGGVAPTVDPAVRRLTLDDVHGEWRSDDDQGLRIGWRPGMGWYDDPKRPQRSVEGTATLRDGVLTIRSQTNAFREFDHVEQFAITVAPRLEEDCRMWMQLGRVRMRRLSPEVDPEQCASDPDSP
jgi:hypothetical protein